MFAAGLRCGSNSRTNVSHSNLPFIYKGYPPNPTCALTHVHAAAHTRTNEDLMTVSEIITRLACSTVGLKLTPCPQTQTHIHIHMYTQAAGPSPQARATRPQWIQRIVGISQTFGRALFWPTKWGLAGGSRHGGWVLREAEAEAAAAPRRKSDNYLFLREMTALASASLNLGH